MELRRHDLDAATRAGVLAPDQAEALWQFLQHSERAAVTPRFKTAHILYYLGGMIAIGAMSLFMTLAWEIYRGWGLLTLALVYLGAALLATERLVRVPHLRIVAGIAATLALVMVPMAVYALQHVLGLWPAGGANNYRSYHTLIDWRWLFLEWTTLAAGCVALWRYRMPFLVLPVAVTLWYLSMDLLMLVLGHGSADFFSERGRVLTLLFGLAMLALALAVDARSAGEQDFAFWLYCFGLLTFWGALSSLHPDTEWGRLAYALVNLGLIAAGAALGRRVFAVFGGLGVAAYLAYLSYNVFRDSLLFPVVLSALGLGTIAAGVLWQRHEAALGRRCRALLPSALRAMVERRRAYAD